MGLAFSDFYPSNDGSGFAAVPGLHLLRRTIAGYYDREIEKHKQRWPFLREGLFDGSMDRLKVVKAGFDVAAATLKQQMGIR
jgi:hypothetical protein